ncbi:MAG TPA: MFS transporter, partial [Stellaceae bacterium]|nr:MFS transporter [Stellaceae bacterium]
MAIERLRQAAGGLGNVARALSHRNYRIYISGNAVQLTGTWLQRVSCGWLAWTLTHSGAWLGIMSMAEFLPVLFLAPLAGVMADRRD